MSSNRYIIICRRNRTDAPPATLDFGELYFTDLNNTLHIGKADGSIHTFLGNGGAGGADGLSAYEIWLAEGNTGTEADFLDSLTGPPGADGADGADATAPAGAVMHFAMSTPPLGWLKANGAAISRATYADLFAAIGTTFGSGNGLTTFNLPDLRGEFIRGWDDGRGIDSGRSFGSFQDDAFESHLHDLQVHTSTASVQSDGFGVLSNSAGNLGRRTRDTSPFITINNAIDSVGGSETRPRNVALLTCIKY